MSTQHIPRDTWRSKSGLASWQFQLDMGVGDALRLLDRTLGDFATVSAVSFTTESSGEDAVVMQGADALAEAVVASNDLDDLIEVDLSLTLRLRGPDGEVQLPLGADAWVSAEGDGVNFTLSLDVDIYAPVSWGRERDNRPLAALNGPRLTGFLTRLSGHGATLIDIDAPDYPEQVDATGFIDSAPPPSHPR